MHFTTILTVLTTTVLAAPASPGLNSRQAKSCYVIGNSPLPAIVSSTSTAIENLIKCSVDGSTTLQKVPDVLAGNQAFSTIDFTQGGKTPLQFSLDLFQTADPLANSDLQAFKDALDVYLATEIGIRSAGGNFFPIKIPKFFIDMQIARIETAQGNPPKEAQRQVTHLRDQVLASAAGESQALKDQVTALAAKLT
ncbi:hypothetical protein DE146DRAFT_482977 [Phaeosphaeria sp. MPI-PUGE-AT-0046c]|nr:hypothetical protein DE146DRAFT_482977 [Phaeosphaeria sp. MPI-PUGE-AT-0046c]